jgi:hypothetical protein
MGASWAESWLPLLVIVDRIKGLVDVLGTPKALPKAILEAV